MGWCVLKSWEKCILGLGLAVLAGCSPKILNPPPTAAISPVPVTLSGVVQLAPVKNERVKAYWVLPSGDVSGSSAAEGLTDANGNFSLSVPPGTYVIKTEGVGEHLDEATQQWQPACELTALVNTQETQEVPVTPMTALLKERVLTLVRESGMKLTEAKALAEEEVAPKFNLNVEDLNQLPVSPWGISDMSALERSSKKRRIKTAEKLAVFSQFVNEFSFTGLSANEKLSKLMQALQADFKDDGKINGSVSGTLGLIAKKAALRWRAGMNAARTATRSPSSALAFKDSNIQEDVESVTGAVTSEEDRFDTGSEIEGWHTDGIYYISGVQTSLDSDGEGLFLDEYYYLGRLAQIADGPLKTGQYYHQGASAHGVFNKVCFSQGGITTELNPNGDGTCSATSRYYEGGELKTGYVSDPTVLLLHMDGSEGGTSFTDSATPPKAATVNGSAAISTDQVKFGTASGVFNSDSDSLTFSAHSQLNFLDQDWTVEFWYYPTDRHGIASSALSVWRDGPVTRAYWFGVLPDGSLFFKLNGDESSDFLSGPMDVVPLNAWSHIAFTRSGSTLRAFLNGNQVGEFQFATPIIDILDTPLAVGAKGSFENSVKGYLDEVRITKGLARYTSNFTPASEPFTIEGAEAGYYIAGVLYPGLDETGTGTHTPSGKYYVNGSLANGFVSGDLHFDQTVLLLHMDGANNSTAFSDASPLNLPATHNGNAVISTAQSKFGSASAYFDGDGDYLSIPNNSGTQLGTGPFTIEAWVYPTSMAGGVIIEQAVIDEGYGNNIGWGFYTYNGNLHFGDSMGQIFMSSSLTNPIFNRWAHVSLVGNGSDIRMYVDGVLAGQYNSSFNMNLALDIRNDTPTIIGQHEIQLPGQGCYQGYIDELRITKGIARYNSNFNPPTVAFGGSSGCYSNGVNTGTVIDGTGACGGVFYLAGAATQLPLNGTGNHDGKQYFSGVLANGLIESVCYVAGVNTGTYSNGNGSCGGSYYIAGVLFPGLDQTGTGTHTSTGKYYVNGSLANGFVSGAPDDDNTVLLLHMDGTNGSTSFTDSSASAFSPELVGSPFISTAQSRFGGASAYFHGTGEYGSSERLQFGASDSLALGTADFTIEGWFFQTGTSQAIPMPLEIGGPHSNSDALGMWFYPNAWGNQGLTGWYSQPYNSSGPATSLNKWTHVAWVRKDGFMTIFVDGVGGSSASMPNSLGGSGLRIGGGAYQNYYNYEGFIDEVRITKGLARYTSNFNPPTVAFGAGGCFSNGVDIGTVINGTGPCEGVYYVAGTATTLPLDGTGDFDGKTYFAGILANGLSTDGICYASGVNTGGVVNGFGYCSGICYDGITNSALEGGSGFCQGLCILNGQDSGELVNGTGSCSTTGLYYVDRAPASGFYNGIEFLNGVAQTQFQSCQEIYNAGLRYSGVYQILPAGADQTSIWVYCEHKFDGGGYTLIADIPWNTSYIWSQIPSSSGQLNTAGGEKLSDDLINSIWELSTSEKRMLIKCSDNSKWGSAVAGNWYGSSFSHDYRSNCGFSYGSTINGWGNSWYMQNGGGACLHGNWDTMAGTGGAQCPEGTTLQFLIR